MRPSPFLNARLHIMHSSSRCALALARSCSRVTCALRPFRVTSLSSSRPRPRHTPVQAANKAIRTAKAAKLRLEEHEKAKNERAQRATARRDA